MPYQTQPHESIDARAKQDIRMPNDYLGRLLDYGHDSACAIHVAAISIHRRDRAVRRPYTALNAADLLRQYGIGWRRFHRGRALAERVGLLERQRGGRAEGGRGAYARDTWTPGGDSYVLLPNELMHGDSTLLAFVAAARIERMPRQARDIASRIGVSTKSPHTIARLVRNAAAAGYISAVRVGSQWIVARPDKDIGNFDGTGSDSGAVESGAIETGAVKTGAAHRLMPDEQSDLADRHKEMEGRASARERAPKGALARSRTTRSRRRGEPGASAAPAPLSDNAKLVRAMRQMYPIGDSVGSMWPTPELGPAPGQPGCKLSPADQETVWRDLLSRARSDVPNWQGREPQRNGYAIFNRVRMWWGADSTTPECPIPRSVAQEFGLPLTPGELASMRAKYVSQPAWTATQPGPQPEPGPQHSPQNSPRPGSRPG